MDLFTKIRANEEPSPPHKDYIFTRL